MRQNGQVIKGAAKWIYVSIPYTGHEDDMPARCKAAHDKYDQDDVIVWTPRDIIKDSSMPYEGCMGHCIEREMQCDEVIFAGGWAESRGCTLEMEVCHIYGIEWKVDARL